MASARLYARTSGIRAVVTAASPARRHAAWRVASRAPRRAFAVLAAALAALVAGSAFAAPEAHIMRIDPRASQNEGAPVLTSVVELVQTRPMAEVLGGCATMTGDGELDCTADALEKPQALWSPIDFPDAKAMLTINVEGTDFPAKFVSKKRWGDAQKDKDDGIGTAYLILIDASATMDKHFDDAKAVASAFVNAMGPNDIVNISFFNDRIVAYTSNWIEKGAAINEINHFAKVLPSNGSSRPLGEIVKAGTTEGFKVLGNVGLKVKVPMHQALVVLSNGSSGLDASSNSAYANELKKYLTNGRFPEDNSEMPKAPLPVVSILFPTVPQAFTGSQRDAEVNQARSFMQSMANNEIGGLFSIVREGEGGERGPRLATAVRQRFDKMWIVKWEVACVGPEKTQKFKLDFPGSDPQIIGDGTFDNVPVGIDPTVWPLDVDVEKTVAYADKNPVYPGGTVRVYGNFCWGGKKERAELYMIPKNQSLPASVSGSIEDAKNAQRQLIEAGMRGAVRQANDQYVEFDVPDKDKFLNGKDKSFTARLVIYDNVAHRTSAVTQDKVITLKASQPPPNYLLYGGAAFGGTVILLLLVAVFRSGGKRRGGGGIAAPPPRPNSGVAPPAPMPIPVAPSAPAPAFVSRATLSGSQGIFTVLPSMEMKAGRDGALCQILLSEPRVSGAHATLKIENGQLFVRDDNSNNGTTLNGQRIPPGAWTPVGQGAQLRFGPVEFSVNLE